MTTHKKLFLIADTNLFLECRALKSLPWDELDADEIELIVTRPVQSELDIHKKNRSGRTFKKALEVSKMLRSFLVSGDERLLIRTDPPAVYLSIMTASRGRPDLAPALDPNFPDDAILLRMMEYHEDHPRADVQLLTHDTGPMATARSLRLTFMAIPDHWLASPQDDPLTAENKKQKTEIERLRRQEPAPVIRAIDASRQSIPRIEFEQALYNPLTPREIDQLLVEVESNFPIANDFGSPESVRKPSSFELGYYKAAGPFVPADSEEIAAYRERDYPEWLKNCRKFFERLHKSLNLTASRPHVCFELVNGGTRPAIGCVVRISAKGPILLFTPKEDEQDGKREDVGFDNQIALPRKPKPPLGKWSIRNMSIYREDPFHDPIGVLRDLDALRPAPARDPDTFYWKNRLYSPGAEASFECQSWRHGVEAEDFRFRLVVQDGDDEVSGAIRCEIHAENLSDPAILTVPVRIAWRIESTYAKAVELVDPASALRRRLAKKGRGDSVQP